MSDTLITVEGLSKSYASKNSSISVLRNINFTIERGSLVIIFGPSGCGKSTLLNMLTGLEEPTLGKVFVNGQDLYQLPMDQRSHFRSQSMGIVHQTNHWVKSMNVLDNIAMPMYLSGSKRSVALKAARESLELVGMSQYQTYLPIMLSGGQQQRVSMARALVADTDIIFADEPTGNLDSKSGQMIMDLLLSCQRDLKRTIVLVTHNLEYLPLSDKQLYVQDGSVVEAGHGQKIPTDILDALKAQMDNLMRMEQAR